MAALHHSFSEYTYLFDKSWSDFCNFSIDVQYEHKIYRKVFFIKLKVDVIEHLDSLNKTLTTDFESIPLSCSVFRKLSIDWYVMWLYLEKNIFSVCWLWHYSVTRKQAVSYVRWFFKSTLPNNYPNSGMVTRFSLSIKNNLMTLDRAEMEKFRNFQNMQKIGVLKNFTIFTR